MNAKKIIKSCTPSFLLQFRRRVMRKRHLKNAIDALTETEQKKYEKEILFMKQQGGSFLLPYDLKEYSLNHLKVYEESGLPYVIHTLYDGKSNAKLFFPRGMKKEEVAQRYIFLLAEQNPNSPHCYFDDDHKLDKSDILFDVGAAEGIVALTYYGLYEKAVLFEGDSMWIEPLKATFGPFSDKVEIVDKYVSNIRSDSTVLLSDYVTVNQKIFIKMDIEGMERIVLKNIQDVLKLDYCRASICTYHFPDDDVVLPNIIKESNENVSLRFSTGYAFLELNDTRCSFRKCMLFVN